MTPLRKSQCLGIAIGGIAYPAFGYLVSGRIPNALQLAIIWMITLVAAVTIPFVVRKKKRPQR